MPAFETQAGSVYDLRIGNVRQFAPSLQDEFQQGIHIGHFDSAVQDILQSLQATTLNTHFLGMRQRGVVSHSSQSESEILTQTVMQGSTAREAGRAPAGHGFAFGNLDPCGTLACDTTCQDGFFERTGTANDFGIDLPVGSLIHGV
jgi:hypothetical protein